MCYVNSNVDGMDRILAIANNGEDSEKRLTDNRNGMMLIELS
jgi:hypothetical protein